MSSPYHTAAKTGMAVGLGKGFITTKRPQAPRPVDRKGVRVLFWCVWQSACWVCVVCVSVCVFFAAQLSVVVFSDCCLWSVRIVCFLCQRLGKRVGEVRKLIRDVVGLAPYEKRVMELIKSGAPKRALKYAKKRVRTVSRLGV
jgi:hypothetical protein